MRRLRSSRGVLEAAPNPSGPIGRTRVPSQLGAAVAPPSSGGVAAEDGTGLVVTSGAEVAVGGALRLAPVGGCAERGSLHPVSPTISSATPTAIHSLIPAV